MGCSGGGGGGRAASSEAVELGSPRAPQTGAGGVHVEEVKAELMGLSDGLDEEYV